MQTSSPSYLLMASLDAARHQAVQQATWVEPVQAAQRIRDGLAGLPGISVLNRTDCACAGRPGGTLSAYGCPLGAHVLSFLICLPGAYLARGTIENCSSTCHCCRRAAWLTSLPCLSGVLEMDALRITVALSGLGLTGWQLASMLRVEHAVIPELASLKVCYACS